jgi:hypothetical protein
MAASFAEIVEQVQQLDVEEKEQLLELIRAWVSMQRREGIAQNAREARAAYNRGELKSGSVNDLMTDLYGED